MKIKEKVLKEIEKRALSSKELRKRVIEEITMENNLIDEAVDLTLAEVMKVIDENYANLISLIEHEFTDDRVAEKITDYIEDYKKELKQKLGGEK